MSECIAVIIDALVAILNAVVCVGGFAVQAIKNIFRIK